MPNTVPPRPVAPAHAPRSGVSRRRAPAGVVHRIAWLLLALGLLVGFLTAPPADAAPRAAAHARAAGAAPAIRGTEACVATADGVVPATTR